jgi:hypothetical protein
MAAAITAKIKRTAKLLSTASIRGRPPKRASSWAIRQDMTEDASETPMQLPKTLSTLSVEVA